MPFRGGMRGLSRGGWIDSSGTRPVRSAPPPQLKFDRDFDFESANAQFDKDQIEKELKEKLVIGMIISF
jgi:protein LSM14